ncbi:MAG: hypothetical protein V8R81_00795 [Clostridia bacterium]
MNNSDFIQRIKIVPNREEQELLKIQKNIENEETDIEEQLNKLTDNQKENLKGLYKKQIEKINIDIEKAKERIIKMKTKLKNS